MHHEHIQLEDVIIVYITATAREIAEPHDREDRHQGVEQDSDHRPVAPLSSASTNKVMASKSAQPPGLRRRATNAACTAAARGRQSRAPTPPSNRNKSAAWMA